MRRGVWHQFGDRSQRLALELLQNGAGIGVIISPRDLAEEPAARYAPQYRDLGAEVLIDQQFYVPDARLGRLPSYGIAEYRDVVSQLHQISDQELAGLAGELERINRRLGATGVIAPAVVYEAARPDIADLNRRLFAAAKQAGDNLGVPTYATVVLGRSVTNSDAVTSATLSTATNLDSDGWYFGFEFAEGRIPASQDLVSRCCTIGLTLAATGRPVLHSYAGPMALLSFAFGVTAAGVGHSQNLWQFTRRRWETPEGQGGGGAAPPRFFSSVLWGTIIYPDETAPLPPTVVSQILTQSPYSAPVSAAPPFLPWSRWDANKHLVYTICTALQPIALETNARTNAASAIAILDGAVALHTQMAQGGISLRDNTNTYQRPWRDVLQSLLANRGDDYDFLELSAL